MCFVNHSFLTNFHLFVRLYRFPDILRNLTREILRSQPASINQFAYEYFANLLQEKAAEGGGADFDN